MEYLKRFIAIDTEYHLERVEAGFNRNGKLYEDRGINKVYCICATTADGRTYSRWTSDIIKGGCPNILNDISEHFNITDPIFICHAFDKAERQAVKFMGANPINYNWFDTYHLARMLQYSFDMKDDEDTVYVEDAIIEAIERKAAKEAGLSYAALCKRFNLSIVDTVHKEYMRGLCINDLTEGNENDILEYCLSDTAFLIPLAERLLEQYTNLLYRAFCPLNNLLFGLGVPHENLNSESAYAVDETRAVNMIIKQCKYIALFGEIADRGLPLDGERVKKVIENAPLYREKLKHEFNKKYQIFEPDKKGKLHEISTKSQEYIKELVEARNITNYPKTAAGKYSLNNEILKDFFKGDQCFGEEYRQLNKLLRQLGTVAKDNGGPFLHYYNGRLYYGSLNPYGTATSRCAPSTKRFIFGWHKSLYGLLNPPPGKWLVELDYGSEETFCQCAICKDGEYNSIYNSKDIYLAFAQKMNLVDYNDWTTLNKSELKEKYSKVRKQIKPMILGLSYGMGAQKLAAKCGLSLDTAKSYHDMIVDKNKGILKKSAQWKHLKLHNNLSPEIVKAFALPDGFICGYTKVKANKTSLENWPFQSAGAQILRELVEELYNLNIEVLATIHDAVFFMVDENDYNTITKVSNIMRDTANRVLSAPKRWSIKVGEPEIIKHGDIWTPEHEFDETFIKLLNFDGGEDGC